VVLGVLYYPQLFWGSRFRLNGTNDDPAAPIIRELRQLVSRIDLTKHRLGIVSYWTDTIVELPLTSDRSSVLSAVQKISRRWPGYGNCVLWNSRVACTSKPNVRDALRAAQGLFEPTSGRRQVIVLYQPDYCNRAFAYYDGECRGYPAAEEAAAAVRAALTEIVVFDGNRTGYRQYRFNGQPYQADAQPLASSDADAVFGYREAQHRMVRYEVPANLATQFELVDTVPDNMRLVPGSIVPPASRVGADVQWALPQLAYRPAPFQLDLTPLQPGHWPTNVQAVARFVDGWGRSGSITFPVPAVDVEWPTPTPEEPTPTVPAIAPTAVGPGPTASPGTQLYLPALVRS
jgi:hypothetical protein